LILGEPLKLADYSFTVDSWFFNNYSTFGEQVSEPSWLYALIKKRSHTNATFTYLSSTPNQIIQASLKVSGFDVIQSQSQSQSQSHFIIEGNKTKHTKLSPTYYSSNLPAWASPNHIEQFPYAKKTQRDVADVLIIGSGLAGLACANAMAKRGLSTTIIDRNAGPVEGATGQKCLIMYSKLPTVMNQEAELSLACTQYSQRYYSSFPASSERAAPWKQCGVMQLDWNETECKKNLRRKKSFNFPPEFMAQIDATTASELSGLPLTKGGLWFPKNGIVFPSSLAKICLSAKEITSIYNCNAEKLTRETSSELWQVTTNKGVIRCHHLVVACAFEAQQFEQTNQFPIKLIRGQTSTLQAQQLLRPNCVVCGEGYLAATDDGNVHIGATYDLVSKTNEPTQKDHEDNLHKINRWLPEWATVETLEDSMYSSKAGLRCTTRDYNPIVGPVPILAEMKTAFEKLREDATACQDIEGRYYKNLYISIGHGSKGVVSTPMAGEIIASQITKSMIPLDARLYKMLHPARFVIKNLIKNEI
jgi:tRNA 5-methylaminomethyl-2-thiouridine biosynthesis bifunctional protein